MSSNVDEAGTRQFSRSRERMSGPLLGVKVIEFATIGPVPFCGMLYSDLGADVVRVDRPDGGRDAKYDVTSRGRRSIALDLKDPASVEVCLRLIEKADGIIEGYRPGVMERLGLGPDTVLERNPRLAYGRMTGWGQSGPYAAAAGHDINYIAISGALDAIGVKARPVAPLNLVGDFGGGALYMAFGLLAAILHARQSGKGQVVDCAMADGAASLMSMFYGRLAEGRWKAEREANVLNGAAPFYNIYQCADARWICVAASEPKFYNNLLQALHIDESQFQDQLNEENWPLLRRKLAQIFSKRPQEEWCTLLQSADVCFAPVMSIKDAPNHPHNAARGTFQTIGDVTQPAPAPRFSLTPGAIQGPAPNVDGDRDDILRDWCIRTDHIALN